MIYYKYVEKNSICIFEFRNDYYRSFSLSLSTINTNTSINLLHLSDVIDVSNGNWCSFSDLLIGDINKSIQFKTQPTAPTLLSSLKINVDSQDLVKVYKEELEIVSITNINAVVKPNKNNYHFVKNEQLTLPFTIFSTNDLSARLGNFKFTHPFEEDLYSMSKSEAKNYVVNQLFSQATSDGLACLTPNQFSQLSLEIYDQNAFNNLVGKITLVTTQNSNIWVGNQTL
ncbi:MAG: hypothetical protein LBC44_01910, partial [Mycoplasmataceae bacterium]|nr:hypothetical protein [Mycoplasmataceae bacterium]